MATLLCDNCLYETDAETMTTLILIDVLRTVCPDCKEILIAQGFAVLFPSEESDNDA